MMPQNHDGLVGGSPSDAAPVIPLVDLSAIDQAENSAFIEQIRIIADASEKSGAFQIIGHGITQDIIDKARLEAEAFFCLPLQDKIACAAKDSVRSGFAMRKPDRYVTSMPGVDMDHAKEIFDFAPYDRMPWSALVPEAFTQAADALYRSIEDLERVVARILSQALALATGLPIDIDWLNDGRGNHRGLLRFNHYPKRSTGGLPRDGAHVDWTPFTFIHSDCPGLEILTRNGWHPVPVDTRCLTVLVGDQLRLWSSGRFLAAKHRVRAANPEEDDRLSVVFFGTQAVDDRDDVAIVPIGGDSGQRNSPIVIRHYLKERTVEVSSE